MYDYIHGLIKSVPERYIDPAGAAIPVIDHIYTVKHQEDGSVDLLNTEHKEDYYSVTA